MYFLIILLQTLNRKKCLEFCNQILSNMKKYHLLILLMILAMASCKNKDAAKDGLTDNPLLQEWNTPYGVPPFDQIKDEHYEPAFEAAMKEQKENVQKIVDNPDEPTFENTIVPLEFSGLLLSKVSGVFFNMLSSNTSDSLQAIAQRISPKLSKHSDEISMNPELFARIEKIYQKKDELKLDKEQMMVLELTYRKFVKSGAKLNDTDKKKLMDINEKMSVLSLKFGIISWLKQMLTNLLLIMKKISQVYLMQ